MIKSGKKQKNVMDYCVTGSDGGSSMKNWKKQVTAWKKDLLFVGICLLIGGGLLAYIYLGRTKEPQVSVRVDGETVETFSLADRVTYEIAGVGGTNVLCIEDGAAWLTEADCPDRICVNTGKIKYVGQSIICLPHKVVVEIKEAQNGE